MKNAIVVAVVALIGMPAAAADYTITITDPGALEALAWARDKYNASAIAGAGMLSSSQEPVSKDGEFINLHVGRLIADWQKGKRQADIDAAVAAAMAGDRKPAMDLLDKVAPQK